MVSINTDKLLATALTYAIKNGKTSFLATWIIQIAKDRGLTRYGRRRPAAETIDGRLVQALKFQSTIGYITLQHRPLRATFTAAGIDFYTEISNLKLERIQIRSHPKTLLLQQNKAMFNLLLSIHERLLAVSWNVPDIDPPFPSHFPIAYTLRDTDKQLEEVILSVESSVLQLEEEEFAERGRYEALGRIHSSGNSLGI